jgi:carboxyl-terminal processing protease
MRRQTYVATVLGVFAVAATLGLVRNAIAEAGDGPRFDPRVVRRVRDIIYRSYVEDLDSFEKKLYYAALQGMTSILDPHSQFLPPQDREELEIDTRGKFGGLGIIIEKPLGTAGPIVIVTPFLGTPASKAGLQPGDMIVEIEGISTIGMELTAAVDKLRGEPGTAVKIKIQRGQERMPRAENAGRLLEGCRLVALDGTSVAGKKASEIHDLLDAKRGQRMIAEIVPEALSKPKPVKIVRSEIQVPSIEFARMVDEEIGIGYIKLARFQQDSPRKLAAAIEKLQGTGMRALVLDLRRNPGGVLSAAIQIADMFLAEGVIVSTRGRAVAEGDSRERFYRAGPGNEYAREDLALAVLVDGGSASASEILAAAIKDNGRGIVVGTRTFGKGSVQKIFDVELGRDPTTGRRVVGSLKLTTEKFYTPGGTSIQRVRGRDRPQRGGVEPNIVVEMTDAELQDLQGRWEKDKITENESPDGLSPDKAESIAADRPLLRAMEILKAVLVLSGARPPAAPSPAEAPLKALEPAH